MPAPTTEELTTILSGINEQLQGGGGGPGGALNPVEALALLAAGTRDETGIGSGIGETAGNADLFGSLSFSPAQRAISQEIFGRDLFAPTSTVSPGGTPVPVLPPAAAPTTPPLAGAFGTAGELNIPGGAEFFGPTLAALVNVLGLEEGGRQFDVAQLLRESQFGETQRQFDQSALANAASMLANLRAQGPASAAELAFLQGGVFPGGQNTGVQISDLIGASTRGAGGTLGLGINDTASQAFQRLIGGLTGGTAAPAPGGLSIDPREFRLPGQGGFPSPDGSGVGAGGATTGFGAGTVISPEEAARRRQAFADAQISPLGGATTGFGAPDIITPNTLSGSQLSKLQANPNLAGVIGSFAQASGNPDLLARSVQALLPSGFTGTGSGF